MGGRFSPGVEYLHAANQMCLVCCLIMQTNGWMFPTLMGLEQEGSVCPYAVQTCFPHCGCVNKPAAGLGQHRHCCVNKCHVMMETS